MTARVWHAGQATRDTLAVLAVVLAVVLAGWQLSAWQVRQATAPCRAVEQVIPRDCLAVLDLVHWEDGTTSVRVPGYPLPLAVIPCDTGIVVTDHPADPDWC